MSQSPVSSTPSSATCEVPRAPSIEPVPVDFGPALPCDRRRGGSGRCHVEPAVRPRPAASAAGIGVAVEREQRLDLVRA